MGCGKEEFTARFWGVRGSIACPGPDTLRYGGNTSCIEVRCGGRLIILDGGTGLRPLGAQLVDFGATDADVLFTHTHFDHVCGLPFFVPMYKPGNTFRLWAGHLPNGLELKSVLCKLMAAPLFPVPLEVMGSSLECREFLAGESLMLAGGVQVNTTLLNHPNGATGYRIEFGGRSICYVTDTEHDGGAADERIVGLIKGADYFIYDCNFTAEEYQRHKGWGHSTWEVGAALADRAEVGTFVIFHHDPAHDDVFMDGIAAAAANRRRGTIVAREGLTLTL